MTLWLALLFAVSPFQQALEFARYLDRQEDPYRAILEYRRALFLLEAPDTLRHDSLVLRIAQLYEALKAPDRAFGVLEEAWDTLSPGWRLERGRALFLLEDYGGARRYWHGRDTLVGWTYLRQRRFSEAARFLGPIPRVSRRSPWLAAGLSALVPGLGKMYAGHFWDGFFSLLLNGYTGWMAYRSYRAHRPLATPLYGGLFAFFYAGNVYGSYVAARQYNDTQARLAIARTEVRLNLWRYLP